MEFRRVLFRSPPYPGIGRFADIEAFSVRAECKTMPALRQSGRIQEIDACPLKRSVYFFEHYPDEFWMVHLPYQQLPAVRAKAIFGNKIGRAQAELQSLMRSSYAVFCLKKKKNN